MSFDTAASTVTYSFCVTTVDDGNNQALCAWAENGRPIAKTRAANFSVDFIGNSGINVGDSRTKELSGLEFKGDRAELVLALDLELLRRLRRPGERNLQ